MLHERPGWDNYFMGITDQISKRATCGRGRSGCVIVKNNRILVTGYVGSPPGMQHCDEAGHQMVKVHKELEAEEVPSNEIHYSTNFTEHCCLHGKTKIKLLNGKYRTIKSLAEKGSSFWVYSIDRKSGKIVPAVALNPIKTGITKNNCPTNLEIHLKSKHAKITHNNPKLKQDKIRVGRSNMTTLWKDENFRKDMKSVLSSNGSKTALKSNSKRKCINSRMRGRVLNGLSPIVKKYPSISKNNYSTIREKNKTLGRGGIPTPKIETILKYFKSFNEAKEEANLYNHKVIHIQKLNTGTPVYDVMVPKYHNFAIKAGDNSCIFVHNCRTIHAEQNAIIQAAKYGISLEGATLYCRMTPCRVCAMFIISVGIERVVCEKKYPKGQESEVMFERAKIPVTFFSDEFQEYEK